MNTIIIRYYTVEKGDTTTKDYRASKVTV